MPDRRKHRGPHPDDARLFAPEQHEPLQRAVAELSWLLTREYAMTAALKLVGDRYGLEQRQRLAVMRSSCSDQARTSRAAKRIDQAKRRGESLRIDGFNLITTIEAALSGGLLLIGRDGAVRDLASVHGTYRHVTETLPALEQIGSTLEQSPPREVVWLLDQPVSNSGRLKQRLDQVASERGWPWSTRLVANPDRELSDTGDIIVTSDAVVLDHCDHWDGLAEQVIQPFLAQVWLLDLRTEAS